MLSVTIQNNTRRTAGKRLFSDLFITNVVLGKNTNPEIVSSVSLITINYMSACVNQKFIGPSVSHFLLQENTHKRIGLIRKTLEEMSALLCNTRLYIIQSSF